MARLKIKPLTYVPIDTLQWQSYVWMVQRS